jgi:aminoglycoside phosphotransferase family enzyme
LKLSFLDFSTLSLRKEFCRKEVQLNRRFSDIYRSVLPVRRVGNQWAIGGPEDANVVDYCVVMKRLATAKRMDNVIRHRSMSERSIKHLSQQVATFHSRAEIIFDPFDFRTAQTIFNDIESVVLPSMGKASPIYPVIRQSILLSDQFLQQHGDRIQQRIDQGLKRDVHGDLHCGNIFAYQKPVIFDCIEFNDSYRRIDVLYEIAFLCMDLEAFHKKHLAEVFKVEYTKHFPAFQEKEDHSLFRYFKALRANVRAKVHNLQARQSADPSAARHHVGETARYLTLMNDYLANL